ncbi:MAG TPA: hypothetical protein VK338_06255 [Candidatus Nitrosocosmicus sp.]|nr:hypothetical protein [Candidatus Nitrosocosmicus sp.]
MIIKVSDIKKADVLSEDGKKMSKIQNILYDPQQKKIVAFMTSKPSLISDAKIIMSGNIKKMSDKAILVDSETSEKKSSQLSVQMEQMAKDEKLSLSKGKVIGEDAIEFGSISDVFLDSQTFKVFGFELSQGTMQDMKSGKKTMQISEIVSVGDDAVIVKPVLKNEAQNAIDKATDRLPQKDMMVEEAPTLSDEKKKQIQDAIGKYFSKNILTENDEILARQGDLVTNEILRVAFTKGLLEDALNHITTKPQ